MNIFKDLGLKEVINANGKMTILGASTVSDTVADRMKSALQNFTIMEELMDFTGAVIADKTGAEAGCPTCGAASAIAIATAACIAGRNLGLIERIPNTDGLPNEVVLQKGQVVNFGGTVDQMVRIGGGVPVEVGCANKVEMEHIESSINARTVALLYIKSHHAVQKGMQSIECMLEIARRYSLPLIVDAAAEGDLQKYILLGADMVIYSGGKALAGPTSGFIAGRKDCIDACRKQYKGIGRAMKVSKEAMIGLVAALEQYNPEDSGAQAQRDSMLETCNLLNRIPGLNCSVVQDEAGREIYRAEITVDPVEARMTAAQINDHLKSGDPAIYLRDYYANQGKLSIDPRPLLSGQAAQIVAQIKWILQQG